MRIWQSQIDEPLRIDDLATDDFDGSFRTVLHEPRLARHCADPYMTRDVLRVRSPSFAVEIVNSAASSGGNPKPATSPTNSATRPRQLPPTSGRPRSLETQIHFKTGHLRRRSRQTVGWLQLLTGRNRDADEVNDVIKEVREILAILSASRRTAAQAQATARSTVTAGAPNHQSPTSSQSPMDHQSQIANPQYPYRLRYR